MAAGDRNKSLSDFYFGQMMNFCITSSRGVVSAAGPLFSLSLSLLVAQSSSLKLHHASHSSLPGIEILLLSLHF
jgi:hypothetical protein